VDSYLKSKAGFLNIGGNVSEWMHDVYASMPEAGTVTDPAGPKTDGPHAIRGASWRTSAIAELRLAWRERASGPAPTIGFRVARFAEVKP
jgi:formylglycine-generating enzyme required for sulfatase activity